MAEHNKPLPVININASGHKRRHLKPRKSGLSENHQNHRVICSVRLQMYGILAAYPQHLTGIFDSFVSSKINRVSVAGAE